MRSKGIRLSAEEARYAALHAMVSKMDLYPYQKAIVFSPARFTWNCWARQTGKSFALSLRRVIRGIVRRRNQIILSAGERQSREVMDKVKQHCERMELIFDEIGFVDFRNIIIGKLEARLPGRCRIIALPANPMTARGYSGDVFLDEFAMHRDDKAIWAALFPTILRGDGELDIASTPHGQKNMFFQLRSYPQFRSGIVTLEEAAAHGLESDVPLMRSSIGDDQLWREEFCCEFLDEATSFMPYELIRSCQDERLSTDVAWERLRRPDADICVGVDLGRHRDITAIWIWKREGIREGSSVEDVFTTQGVLVLQDTPLPEQEAMLARILNQRGVRRMCLDATGMGMHMGELLTKQFGSHRFESINFSSSLKSQLAGGVKAFAERGLLRIPTDEAIVNDWHSMSRLVTAGGHVRFDADRSSGGHADRFWAAALGLHAAGTRTGRAEGMTGHRMRFARDGAL